MNLPHATTAHSLPPPRDAPLGPGRNDAERRAIGRWMAQFDGRPKSTRRSYLAVARKLSEWLDHRHPDHPGVLKATSDDIGDFVARSRDGGPMPPATARHHLSVLSGMYAWLRDEGLVAANPVVEGGLYGSEPGDMTGHLSKAAAVLLLSTLRDLRDRAEGVFEQIELARKVTCLGLLYSLALRREEIPTLFMRYMWLSEKDGTRKRWVSLEGNGHRHYRSELPEWVHADLMEFQRLLQALPTWEGVDSSEGGFPLVPVLRRRGETIDPVSPATVYRMFVESIQLCVDHYAQASDVNAQTRRLVDEIAAATPNGLRCAGLARLTV